jgi:hypothetical protein
MPTFRLPTTTKVVALSILLFIEAFIAGVLPITQEGNMPNEVQLLTITLVAVAAVVTYLIAQVK